MLGNMVAGGCSLFGAGFFSELEVMRTDRLQCRPSGRRIHGYYEHHPRLGFLGLYGFSGVMACVSCELTGLLWLFLIS